MSSFRLFRIFTHIRYTLFITISCNLPQSRSWRISSES